MALILVFLPGLVAARLLRAPLPAALALAPGLSTTAVVLAAAVSSAVGVPWGAVPLIAGVLVVWLTAATLGALLHRYGVPEEPSRLPFAALIATAVTAVAVALVLLPVSRTPESFPQHPDTIFHLGVAQWMIEHQDASTLHAFGFVSTSGSGFYPAAFHAMVASIAQLTGAPVVVSTSSFVLVIAGAAWPLGCVFLARTLFGPGLALTLSAGAVSVAFSAFPFMLMGFGVLWPNLFGMALLPAALALLAVVMSAAGRQSPPLNSRLRATVLLLATVPGVVVAHPNAFVTLLLFGALMAAEILLGKAWQVRRDRPWLAAAGYVFLIVATGVALAASTILGPKTMRQTGTPGPELPSSKAITDTLLFAPRGAVNLWVLAALVAVGAGIVLVRHRGRRWLVAAWIITSALFYLNVAVDNPTARLITWPWYNNAVRLAVIGVLPAALLAIVSLVTGARLVTKHFRLPQWVPAVAVALLFVVATGGGYAQAHRRVLNPFFHPVPSRSWASNAELRALHRLARYVPPDAVVAENAWNGGSYMYIVSGRHMLFPTEKAREPGDRTLLALRLDDVGTSPKVCAAARRQHVQFAITGGRPFAWAGKRGTREYAGVDAVGSSDAFRKVARDGPYTLYQMVKCASG